MSLSFLHKKLLDATGKDLIKTIKGKGENPNGKKAAKMHQQKM